MSYVDDSTIIVQSKMWGTNLTKLQSTYSMVFELIQFLGLVLEHNKSEVFHFPGRVGTLTLQSFFFFFFLKIDTYIPLYPSTCAVAK